MRGIDDRFPEFYIVGTAKAGTTALHSYLEQHPSVFVCRPKEPCYFSDDMWIPHAVHDEDECLSLFHGAERGQLRGEASPNYLYSSTAIARIHEVRPDAKLIAVLRQPADMMYSLHGQLVFNGDEPLASFESALWAEPFRRRGWLVPRWSFPVESLQYRAYARYGRQMERLLSVFPREQVLVLFFDRFRRDPAACLREVLAFLEVDPAVSIDTPIVNAARRVRVPGLHYGATVVSRVAQRLRREQRPWWLPRRDGITRRAVTALEHVRTALVEEGGRRPIKPATRRRLTLEAESDIALLEAILELDLTNWRVPG